MTAHSTPEHTPERLTITILYDNHSFDERLKTDWGYSALVEFNRFTLLFDTGTDGAILLDNMSILNVDPDAIDAVVLSHAHKDHTGGLADLLKTVIQPPVYLPPSFSASFKRQVSDLASVVEVKPGLEIHPGLYTTGEIKHKIPEQALVVRAEQGLIVITGCAHPGIVRIIEQAQALFEDPVYLVMGGFHLRDKDQAEITAILSDFRRLGVQKVAPSHCTGDLAIEMFAEEFEEDYLKAGAGRTIHVGE